MDIAAETARAYAAFAAGKYDEARDCAERVLRSAADDPATLTLKGRLALLGGEPDTAEGLFRRVVERHPRVVALWLDLASALRDLGRHEEAARAVTSGLTLEPDSADAWLKRGDILLSLGDREAAADAFRRVLALRRDSVPAFRGLCLATDVAPDSEPAQRMLALARSSSLSPREQAELHYALAQVFRQAGRGRDFIDHVLAANAKQRALCRDGRAEYAAIFDGLEGAFTREAFAAVEHADPIEPSPIFVLGMPRSGTTLVERLLAAHPDVAAGGELNYMRGPLRRAVEQATGRPFPQGFAGLARPQLCTLATAFERRLQLIGRGARYVTDKTPGNYHLLGLLRVLFPSGKIIHVARSPMDTCFSILQHPFDDRSPHTCDMELLGYVYGRYRRLMRRWEELFGTEFVTVEYERLVSSPAVEARRLYEFCGLEWRDAYLDLQRAGTAVRTFSSAQVRRPIYRSSIEAWREFAAELAPLRSALDAALLDTGSH